MAMGLRNVTAEDIRGMLAESTRQVMQEGGARAVGRGAPEFSISPSTRDAYEKRIDELFAGAEPNNQNGVRVLDRSDVLDMMGRGDYEVLLAEQHAVSDGRYNHPQFSAADWKMVPEWLENPVAVFQRPDRNLAFIAPETKDGRVIVIGLKPEATSAGFGHERKTFHLLLTAFDKDSKLSLEQWVRENRLRYVDMRKTPKFNRDAGHQLPSHAAELRGLKGKIYTGADLFKYKYRRGKGAPQPDLMFDLAGAEADPAIAAVRSRSATCWTTAAHSTAGGTGWSARSTRLRFHRTLH